VPRIIRTQAISLHSSPFAESSKIVTFYTRDFGKLNFLAKGARRPKSKFGGALETFTHASLIIYKPETPKLYILSDAEIICSYSELQASTEKYLAGSQIVEFVLKATDFEEANARLFNLLLSALNALASKQSVKNLDSLVLAFLLKGASFLGYRPELDNCVSCRKKCAGAKIYFDFINGGILCIKCKLNNTRAIIIEPNQIAYLKALLYFPIKRSANLMTLPELKDFILQYMKHHFERFDLAAFTLNRTDFKKSQTGQEPEKIYGWTQEIVRK